MCMNLVFGDEEKFYVLMLVDDCFFEIYDILLKMGCLFDGNMLVEDWYGI